MLARFHRRRASPLDSPVASKEKRTSWSPGSTRDIADGAAPSRRAVDDRARARVAEEREMPRRCRRGGHAATSVGRHRRARARARLVRRARARARGRARRTGDVVTRIRRSPSSWSSRAADRREHVHAAPNADHRERHPGARRHAPRARSPRFGDAGVSSGRVAIVSIFRVAASTEARRPRVHFFTSSRAANVLVPISPRLGGRCSSPLARRRSVALRRASPRGVRGRDRRARARCRRRRCPRETCAARARARRRSCGRSVGSSAIARSDHVVERQEARIDVARLRVRRRASRRRTPRASLATERRLPAPAPPSGARRRAKMSVGGPSSLPSTCSGGMWPGEPKTSCPATCAGAAMPKSISFT